MAGSLLEAFADNLERAGGRLSLPSEAALPSRIDDAYPEAGIVASACPELVPGTLAIESASPADLAGVELFVCRATLGVAENGALWLSENALVHRSAPFLAEHVAIFIERDALVATMHDAYARLDVAATPFGVFIAGPSKTADIEQSLVIGAHGPRSLTAIVL